MTGMTMPETATPTNDASTMHDLFALSDEQILEIEAEPQDIEIADVFLDDADRAVLVETVSDTRDLAVAEARESRASADHTASHPTPETAVDPAAPPQWLADRMSDPQAGAEARALWDSVQQSRTEAAGFREIFAKPEEARAAAQRARLLDDIDHAYFAGDATLRASLAASMLREDPAAFREMVFAGLRALEEGAQAPTARGDASPRAHQVAPDATTGNSGSFPSPNSRVNDAASNPQPVSSTRQAAPARPGQTDRDSAVNRVVAPSQTSDAADAPAASDESTHRVASDSARDARHPHGTGSREANRASNEPSTQASRSTDPATTDHIAANYAAFERSTNDDLERIVGGTIDRTLDRALPHNNRADNTAIRTRLAASIRQDVERSLQGDRQLGEQVAQVLSARRLDESTRSQIVRLIGERAQQLVPGTARRVLGEWTQTTLAAHRERGGRTDATLLRRDLDPVNGPRDRSATASAHAARAQQTPATATSQRGTSSGRPAQAASPRAQKVDYRRVSDEQILDW